MKKLLYLTISILVLASCSAYKSALAPDRGEVVNIGYGAVPKDNLTGSVSKVKLKEADMTYDTIYDYLRGRVPGVFIGPGNPPSITIRGKGSINSSTEPLILVDGVEVQDISMISPYDVESVEVIKDGTSAIYGVRGANGVILITTKH